MRIKFATVVIFACISSGSLFAADNVNLNVSGTLTNAACEPSLSNGGVVDFGHIPLGGLDKTSTNQLGHKKITLTITCESPMAVAFRTTDNRSDSREVLTIIDSKGEGFPSSDQSNGGFEFGLGKTAGGENIGSYAFSIASTPTADGVVKDLIFIKAEHDTEWVKSDSGSAQVGTRAYSVADSGTLVPKAAKITVYPIKVTAAIQGTDKLNITDDTNLDGLATISLIYP